jgi:hypothetical protein
MTNINEVLFLEKGDIIQSIKKGIVAPGCLCAEYEFEGKQGVLLFPMKTETGEEVVIPDVQNAQLKMVVQVAMEMKGISPEKKIAPVDVFVPVCKIDGWDTTGWVSKIVGLSNDDFKEMTRHGRIPQKYGSASEVSSNLSEITTLKDAETATLRAIVLVGTLKYPAIAQEYYYSKRNHSYSPKEGVSSWNVPIRVIVTAALLLHARGRAERTHPCNSGSVVTNTIAAIVEKIIAKAIA